MINKKTDEKEADKFNKKIQSVSWLKQKIF